MPKHRNRHGSQCRKSFLQWRAGWWLMPDVLFCQQCLDNSCLIIQIRVSLQLSDLDVICLHLLIGKWPWLKGHCRSGFTTFSPVSSLEQYRCGSFVGGAQIAQGVGYQGIRRTQGFTWFGPPERNTLRPQVNGVVLLCLSARLRSSLFSLSVRMCGVRPPATVVCPDLL
jgi:hypothetical protein